MVLETLIGTTVGYLANNLKKSKGGKQASDDLSVAIWEWIRPIFLKDEKKKKELKQFESEPEATDNKKAIAAVLHQHLQANPVEEARLRNFIEKAQAKHPERMGDIFNYAPVNKQVNNPNIQGDLNM